MLGKTFFGSIMIALALSGCLTGGDGSTDPQPPSGALSDSSPYVVQGNRILVPARPDTAYYCQHDTLEPVITTRPSDTLPFAISGDTLTLVLLADTTQSGAVVERILLFVRIGGRGGLEGSWRETYEDYRVASGTLTAEEKAGFDDNIANARFSDSFDEIVYVIEAGSIWIYKDEKTAESAMARWTGAGPTFQAPDSTRYDMDVRIVDKYTLEYRGRRTSETIRVTQKPIADLDIVSLNPEHGAYHFRKKTRSCPEEGIPKWYFDFFADNAKTPAP